MKCDVIALGLISAIQETGIKIPLVVRLQGKAAKIDVYEMLTYFTGTNVDAAKKIMEESGLR